MSARQVVAGIGRALIAVGALLLLFVSYQLWGTGLAESNHQSSLRHQFDQQLAHAGHPSTTQPPLCPNVPTVAGAAAAAPAEGQPVGELVIPKIGLDKVIVEGTSTADLRSGPGHYTGTPLPGQAGNAAIAGHRTTYGAPFYNLDQLAAPDPICVRTEQGWFIYRVSRTVIVNPSDNSVLQAAPTNELTLTTCNPRFSSAQRLVVQATLDAATPAPSAPHRPAPPASADGLAGEQGAALPAILWGAALVAVGVAVWLFGRRRRHKWAYYGAGLVPVLAVLFFFFGAVSPLLPASF